MTSRASTRPGNFSAGPELSRDSFHEGRPGSDHSSPRPGPREHQNHGSGRGRGSREQTVDSQGSSSTLSAEHSQSGANPHARDGDRYWVCCGGGRQSCPVDGTYLVDLHPECEALECQHRMCDQCRTMHVSVSE